MKHIYEFEEISDWTLDVLGVSTKIDVSISGGHHLDLLKYMKDVLFPKYDIIVKNTHISGDVNKWHDFSIDVIGLASISDIKKIVERHEHKTLTPETCFGTFCIGKEHQSFRWDPEHNYLRLLY